MLDNNSFEVKFFTPPKISFNLRIMTPLYIISILLYIKITNEYIHLTNSRWLILTCILLVETIIYLIIEENRHKAFLEFSEKQIKVSHIYNNSILEENIIEKNSIKNISWYLDIRTNARSLYHPPIVTIGLILKYANSENKFVIPSQSTAKEISIIAKNLGYELQNFTEKMVEKKQKIKEENFYMPFLYILLTLFFAFMGFIIFLSYNPNYLK